MGKIFLTISIIVLSFLGWFFANIYIELVDSRDYVIVKTIPKYPNGGNWLAGAGSGFPDGSPSGDVSFTTDDDADKVFDYYKKVLADNGWVFIDEKTGYAYGPDQTLKSANFSKRIYRYNFSLTIGKSEVTDIQKKSWQEGEYCKRYPKNCIDFGRNVTITITRK